jgi:hypothetical protein
LEGLQGLGIELFHAVPSLLIFGAFLNVVEDVVDGFFRIVSRDGASDIGEEFGIVFSGLGR